MLRRYNTDATTWEKTLKVCLVLIQLAADRKTITYGRLGRAIGDSHGRNVGDPHLNRIARYCAEHHLPVFRIACCSEGNRSTQS